MFDLVARSAAERRLVLLDACRERIELGRQVGPDPRTVATDALLDAIAEARGQVILQAAESGGYAFDDPTRRNGVFTAAVLDGLRCHAETDRRGFITARTLAAFVDRRVREWHRWTRNREPGHGIEQTYSGASGSMPLAACRSRLRPAAQPARVRVSEDRFHVFNLDGLQLWAGEIDGGVVRAEVADLNGDGKNEVIVAVGARGGPTFVDRGADRGKLLVYGVDGELLWSRQVGAQSNYEGGTSGEMTINNLMTADLFRRGDRQVTVSSVDAQGWYPSQLLLYDHAGTLLSTYWHPGHLHHIGVAEKSPDETRIVVAGINNDLRTTFGLRDYVAGVFALDPRDVHGEAPPFFGKIGRGSELWYGILMPEGQQVRHLEVLDRDQDGTDDLSIWTSTNHVHYLDLDGRHLAAGSGDGASGTSVFAQVVKAGVSTSRTSGPR